jgi:CelD/BcsL family acetyltransferase involved in cellulose biosynthesis
MPASTKGKNLFEVKLATSHEFITSRDKWNALAAAMKYPTIFCTWEWIHTWWIHFGSTDELVVLFIYRENVLTGILPLFLVKNRANFLYSIPRKLVFCGTTQLYPDHLDIISASDDAAACLDAAFHFLGVAYSDWDILHLPYIAEDSNILSWLEKNRNRIKWKVSERTPAPYIKIAASFTDYLEKFGSRHRYSLTRWKKKLFKRTDVTYDKCSNNPMKACLATLFDLHARRAGEKRINSSFSGEEIFCFHADLVKAMRDKDWVWMRFLNSGEQAIAGFYGFAFGNRVFFYQTGHDPDWHSFAPGTVILHEAIQEAFDGHYEEFNFLQGDEDYKYKWTKTQRILYSLSVYHDNLPGRAVMIMHTMKQILKKFLHRNTEARTTGT